MPMYRKIDKRKMLMILQDRGRITMTEIAQILGVSDTAARKQLVFLEDKGFIKGYSAIVDWQKFEGSEYA